MQAKKFLTSIFMAIFLVFLSFGSSVADNIAAGDTIKFQDLFAPRPSGYSGGPFLATVNNDFSFKTFCVEFGESINFETTFFIDAINTQTVATSKLLSGQAKYLYYNYRVGKLDELSTFEYGSALDERTLQGAIWFSIGWDGDTRFTAQKAFFDIPLYNELLAISAGMGSNINNVVVLNLKDGAGNNRQDVLAMVPEPGTLLLLGLGLVGLAGFARKRFKS